MESDFILRLLQQYQERDLQRERRWRQSMRRLRTTPAPRMSWMSAVLTRLQAWSRKRLTGGVSLWPTDTSEPSLTREIPRHPTVAQPEVRPIYGTHPD